MLSAQSYLYQTVSTKDCKFQTSENLSKQGTYIPETQKEDLDLLPYIICKKFKVGHIPKYKW